MVTPEWGMMGPSGPLVKLFLDLDADCVYV